MRKVTSKYKTGQRVKIHNTWPYHLMLFPGMLVLIIYTIIPFFGNIIAFQNFQPILGIFKSKLVGLDNFKYIYSLPYTYRIFYNSFVIAVGKLLFTMFFSLFFSVLLYEIGGKHYKKAVQTICFLPHFLSWVILATVFRNLFDELGIINEIFLKLGVIKEAILYLGDNSIFPKILIGTDVWKEFGYGAIIFIAALAGINPELYEAASIDGAGRLGKIWHVTLPGIRITIVIVATLNIGSILNAGFDQIYNLYSPIVYKSGDIIDTYVYRTSFQNAQYSFATAVGLLKSAISFVLIITAYKLADRFAHYRIF